MASFLGAGLAIIAKPWADLVFRSIWEKRALRGELADIARHFERDLVVLDALIAASPAEKMRLSSVHAKRLRILDDSLILRPDSFRDLPTSWMANVYHYKLLIRNLDLDIADLIGTMERGDRQQVHEALQATRSRVAAAHDRTVRLRRSPSAPLPGSVMPPQPIWIADDTTR